jgi:sodium/hydrogen antiporter
MYQNAAILSVFVLVYSAVAGWVKRSWLSGPIVFTVAGLLLGPFGLGLVHLNLGAGGLRWLAELTLAPVLFTMRQTRISTSSDEHRRAGKAIVDRHSVDNRARPPGCDGFISRHRPEMALLAALLAPTDAALGNPVVTNPTIPAVMREALNIESGLNGGICVPVVVLLLLGLAVGTQLEHGTMIHAVKVVVEEPGIGWWWVSY